MRHWNIVNLRWLLAVALFAAGPPARADWLPVTSEDRQMTSEPLAPKASAIFLYRQVDRDDGTPLEHVYLRAKILTEEGRQNANVEIKYNEKWESVRDIEARTIHPDGTIIGFKGTIFDKQLAEGRGLDLRAKVFALPDVQIGDIIEYRFVRTTTSGRLYDSKWVLSSSLFTRDANFSLRANRHYALRYSWPRGLPPGTSPPTANGGVIRLEPHNIPAFVKEEHMPPEDELKYRVDFIYALPGEENKDPELFWKNVAKTRFKAVENFVDQHRAMTEAVSHIVMPADTSDQKLRKIYARVQQMRNVTFDRFKSKQEKDREDESDIKEVGEVWRRGYGNERQLNLLFLALARAAGFRADTVFVSTRNAYFFRTQDMNSRQLNDIVILVSDGGKEIYLDPGTPFTPFGLLPWPKTGTRGLLLDKDGGRWLETSLPLSTDSMVAINADFHLKPTGELTGRVTTTLTGLEALACRLDERNEDEPHRKQYLENMAKLDIPGSIEVSSVGSGPDWSGSESPFVAEFEVTIADWATLTGQRAIMPVAVFSGRWKHAFEHAARTQAIYFPFAFEYTHDVKIELPQGWSVASLPKARDTGGKVLVYRSTSDYSGGVLELKRDLTSRITLAEVKYYDAVRDFFQTVRTADAEQIVLSAGATHP